MRMARGLLLARCTPSAAPSSSRSETYECSPLRCAAPCSTGRKAERDMRSPLSASLRFVRTSSCSSSATSRAGDSRSPWRTSRTPAARQPAAKAIISSALPRQMLPTKWTRVTALVCEARLCSRCRHAAARWSCCRRAWSTISRGEIGAPHMLSSAREGTSAHSSEGQPTPLTPAAESAYRVYTSESVSGKLPSGPLTIHSTARPRLASGSKCGGMTSWKTYMLPASTGSCSKLGSELHPMCFGEAMTSELSSGPRTASGVCAARIELSASPRLHCGGSSRGSSQQRWRGVAELLNASSSAR
mmetsp:Transcript_6802/g.15776  ORF Transcript_6802/g.15776 Transcript_6802/m.15776 type:complete len:302 (-) Transcript_6802:1393-2298(-)